MKLDLRIETGAGPTTKASDDSIGLEGLNKPAAGPPDLSQVTDYFNGTADAATAAVVESALSDPQSALSRFVNGAGSGWHAGGPPDDWHERLFPNSKR
jgi:hypothetical protein